MKSTTRFVIALVASRRTPTKRKFIWFLIMVLLMTMGYVGIYHTHISHNLVLKVLSRTSGNAQNLPEMYDKKLMDLYLQKRQALTIKRENFVNRTCTWKDYWPCVDPACNVTFLPPEKRLQRLLTAQYKLSDVHLDLLRSTGAQVPPADLVFVTAASEDHFEESQGVIKDLHEKVFPWLKNNTNYSYAFIFYDIGLSNKSLALLTKYCRCHVLTFPFHSLPLTFKSLKTYQWKPFILKAHSPYSKLLLWMDACVRFRSGNFDYAIKRVMADGFLMHHNSIMMPYHVMPSILEYFQTEACLFAPFYETESGFIIIKNDPLINKAVVEPWLSCALAPRCIYPGDDWLKLLWCGGQKPGYSRCHRFDQAALGVILVMLFDYKVTQLVARDTNVIFMRDNKVKYFPTLTQGSVTQAEGNRSNTTTFQKHL